MPIRKNPAIFRASAQCPSSASRGQILHRCKGEWGGHLPFESRGKQETFSCWVSLERLQGASAALEGESRRELKKASWFPELSSGSKPAAPGPPAQHQVSVAKPRNSPLAPLLESGSRMGLAWPCCSESPCAQGCALRDGAMQGHPCVPHPTGGPSPPGAAASHVDLALLAAVALAHAAPRRVCRSLVAAVVGLSSPTGSRGAVGGRKPGSALGLGGVSTPSAPGLSAQ